MTLLEIKQNFLQEQILRGNAKRTFATYDERITKFIKHVGNIEVQGFTRELVNGYIFELFKMELSRETERSYIRDLKVFAKYMFSTELKGKEFEIILPKKRHIVIDILMPNEIRKLVDLYDYSTFESARSRLMIILLLECGFRKEELRNVQVSKIDLTNKYIKTLGKGQKERFIPISDYVCREIYDYIAEYRITKYLFITKEGTKLTDDGFKSFMRRLKKKSGIHRIYYHLFRHTFATYYLIQNNYDIFRLQFILGHSDLKMVQHYLQIAQAYNVIFSSDNRNSIVKGILEMKKIA